MSRGRAARWCGRVATAEAGLLRRSSHGRGRLAPQAACDAVSRWARCGARLGRADPRLAAPRAESNLHPRVPTGPASPCSPPLVTALWLVRGSRRAAEARATHETTGQATPTANRTLRLDSCVRGSPIPRFVSRFPLRSALCRSGRTAVSTHPHPLWGGAAAVAVARAGGGAAHCHTDIL